MIRSIPKYLKRMIRRCWTGLLESTRIRIVPAVFACRSECMRGVWPLFRWVGFTHLFDSLLSCAHPLSDCDADRTQYPSIQHSVGDRWMTSAGDQGQVGRGWESRASLSAAISCTIRSIRCQSSVRWSRKKLQSSRKCCSVSVDSAHRGQIRSDSERPSHRPVSILSEFDPSLSWVSKRRPIRRWSFQPPCGTVR